MASADTRLGVVRPDAAARDAAVAFLDRIFPAPRRFRIRLWDGTEMPGDGDAPLTLVVARQALRRTFRPPVELSLGEAYLRGDIDLEGDIAGAADIVSSGQAAVRGLGDVLGLVRGYLALPRDEGPPPAIGFAAAEMAGGERDIDRKGARYHYDVGNDFYRLFLDERMQYTCAYYPAGTEDLDLAQERKLEHICRKLRLRPGERLLDIGCGWGGLLIYAAQRYGIHGVGVTLAEKQHALARERVREAGLGERIDVRIQDYRDVADGPFDKLVSIGMVEAVGRARLPEYFGHAYRLLKPGGLFLNHGIADRAAPARGNVGRRLLARVVMGQSVFSRRYVFPVGDIPPVSESCLAAEHAGFEVHDVENLRPHYERTLHQWLSRLEARRNEAVQIGGEAMYRLWRLYLGVAAGRFASGQHTLNQALLGKSDRGRSGVPLSRADLYA